MSDAGVIDINHNNDNHPEFPKFWEKLRDKIKSLSDKAPTSPLLSVKARLQGMVYLFS